MTRKAQIPSLPESNWLVLEVVGEEGLVAVTVSDMRESFRRRVAARFLWTAALEGSWGREWLMPPVLGIMPTGRWPTAGT